MDVDQRNLQYYAYHLRLLITSISNLEEFASYILPDDTEAARLLFGSLQHIQSQLESWACSSPPTASGRGQLQRISDSLYPCISNNVSYPDVFKDIQSWNPDSIISRISDTSPIFDVTMANDGSDMPSMLDGLHKDTNIMDDELSLSLLSSLSAQTDGLQDDLDNLCSSATSQIQCPGSTESSIPPSVSSDLPKSQFILTTQQVKNGLVSYLRDMSSQSDFTNVIHIEDLPRVSCDSIIINPGDVTDDHHRGITYQQKYREDIGHYVCRFVADGNFEFQTPLLAATEELPPDNICAQFLETLPQEAAQRPSVSYLVGPPLDEQWNGFIDAGKELKSLLSDDVKGINSPYWHLGEKFSGTAFHKEDGDLRSMNLTLYGFKLWLMVDIRDTEKFEAWVRDIWGRNASHDDQWLRHLNLILPPSMLQQANIRFRIICARPGDIVITFPNQYHYAVNMTSNLAIAINFLFPGEPIAKQQIFLCKQCGLYPLIGRVDNLRAISIQETAASGKRSQPDSGSTGKRRRRSETSLPDADIQPNDEDARRTVVIRKLQTPPISCLVPTFSEADPPNAKILRLAMAMRGHSAITQVWQLRQDYLKQSPNFAAALIDRNLSGHCQEEALHNGLAICAGASQGFNLLRRLLTWHFAELVQRSKKPTALRASSGAVKQWVGKNPRSRYNKLKYRGDLLHMICGSHRGLLPFIPLQRDDDCGIRDPEGQYQYTATKKEFMEFEKIFQLGDMATKVLCVIGTNFLDSWGYKHPCDFQYDDWLVRLKADFNEEQIRSISYELGDGPCGCGRNNYINE
ncbi:hypothetical protein GGI35DRAFT_447801 [Trichoderma velutinum]